MKGIPSVLKIVYFLKRVQVCCMFMPGIIHDESGIAFQLFVKILLPEQTQMIVWNM